jgi:catechol 2,3-dioxygenase-like lactoylglutathione lyase family enzyme
MTARLDAIGIVVADMERSLAFYRRLGLDISTDAAAEDHTEATLPGGLRLMWDTEESIRSFDPSWTAPQGSPRTSLAFACDSAADVDRVYAELTEAGYAGQREPWDAFWGQRYATVGDPDGNAVDLFAALPGREPGEGGEGGEA